MARTTCHSRVKVLLARGHAPVMSRDMSRPERHFFSGLELEHSPKFSFNLHVHLLTKCRTRLLSRILLFPIRTYLPCLGASRATVLDQAVQAPSFSEPNLKATRLGCAVCFNRQLQPRLHFPAPCWAVLYMFPRRVPPRHGRAASCLVRMLYAFLIPFDHRQYWR